MAYEGGELKIETYQGLIRLGSNEGEDDLLEIEKADDSTYFLAEKIGEDIEAYGNFLTVRYWLSDRAMAKEELTDRWLKKIYGIGESNYDVYYGDYSGYLYTSENLLIGGHDLLSELKSAVSKYLYLEIEYHRAVV